MRPGHRHLALLCGLLLCGLLAGCSLSFTTDGQSPAEGVTEQIEADYEKQADLELRRLECEEFEAEVGAEIHCRGVNSAGVRLVLDGEIDNVDGDEFGYRWDVTRAVAPGAAYAEAAVPVVERLAGEPISSLRCEDGIVVRAGTVVDCRAKTAAGEVVPIQLRLTDRDGGFDVVTDGGPDGAPSGAETAGA